MGGSLSETRDGKKARLAIVRAATVIGWHRQGFGPVLALEDSTRQARPPGGAESVRELIRMLSREKPQWVLPTFTANS
jgi:hypothetical protein